MSASREKKARQELNESGYVDPRKAREAEEKAKERRSTRIYTAVIVAFVQVLLSWAQRYVPASRAAVIFAMESVFAAIIGWFAGESLGTAGIIGGVLIVGGILCGEIRLPRRKAAPKELSS